GAGGSEAAGAPSFTRETQTYFTVPLEPLFQRSPRVERTDQDVKAAEADVQVARRRVAVDAARLFFRVALAQAALAAAEQTRAGLEQLVTYNRARVSQGVSPEIDLMRAQVELDRTAANMTLSEVELNRSRAELGAFIGLPEGGAPTFAVVVPEPAGR